MAETQYLYGASVQGIQEFIFKTNKLKDIVGASELVDQICNEAFKAFKKNGELIQSAAGGIKCRFNEEDCTNAVLHFPKTVMEMAPGITISQAVVKMENEFKSFSDAVNELEIRLRIQRNKPFRSLTMGLLGVERSRTTGVSAVKIVNGEVIDQATLRKREASNNANSKLCKKNFGIGMTSEYGDLLVKDIDKMTDKNDWIAIIHADGNGLGQIIPKIGRDEKQFKAFSNKLDEQTCKSAVDAFNAVKDQFADQNVIPIRPIVLSGDDHTVICRADLAINYTKAFLKAFEENTKELAPYFEKELGFDHLTACAGISFIKSSFPFHYGYHLAEELCSKAKIDAKKKEHVINGLPQSCLMFYKVQDSFVEKYADIVNRELITQTNISFEYGPYYLNDMTGRWTIDELWKNSIDKLMDSETKQSDSTKSHLREWMTLLYENREMAKQKIIRLKQQKNNDLSFIEQVTTPQKRYDDKEYIPTYDMLVLNTIYNQKTKL